MNHVTRRFCSIEDGRCLVAAIAYEFPFLGVPTKQENTFT